MVICARFRRSKQIDDDSKIIHSFTPLSKISRDNPFDIIIMGKVWYCSFVSLTIKLRAQKSWVRSDGESESINRLLFLISEIMKQGKGIPGIPDSR